MNVPLCKFLVPLLFLSVAFADQEANDVQLAFRLVESGIQKFTDGQLDEAAKEFERAIEVSTDRPVIRFDQACIDLAKGENDAAKEKLREAVKGSQPEVVQSAHYNLGYLKVQQVKQTLGPDPEKIPKKSRTEVVDELEQAARHFRSTLEINPQHQQAAHNLELIRLYLKKLQSLWKQQDQQTQESQESLPDLLLRLHEEYRGIQSRVTMLSNEAPSASRTTAAEKVQADASLVQADVQKVRPAVQQWLQTTFASGPTSGAPTAQPQQPSNQQVQAAQMLMELVDGLEESADRVVSSTDTEDLTQAEKASGETIESLHQLVLNVSAYQEVLRAALKRQDQLNQQTPNSSAAERMQIASEQQFQTDFGTVLQLLASEQGPQVEQQVQQLQQQLETKGTDSQADPQKNGSAAERANSSEQQQQQLHALLALQESMNLAVEHTPDIIRLSDESVETINQLDTLDNDSEPKEETATDRKTTAQRLRDSQEQILDLLKKIAEPLRDQNSNQSDSGQNQQQNSGQQNSGQQGEQNPEDSQPSQQDDSQQDAEENDGEQKDTNQPDESSADAKESSEPEDQKDDLSNQDSKDNEPSTKWDSRPMAVQQAEAVLRKAAEREQEYRERLKLLQRLKARRSKVSRDW